MSIALPTVNLAAASVGQSATISWQQQTTIASIPQGHAVGYGTVQLFNESGCGLQLQLRNSGDQTFIAAGGWRSIALGADDISLTYTVLYVIPNAPVSSLVVLYYKPGEPVDQPGILGNSPIGLSGTVQTSVTQVIQDGQTVGLIILEATPALSGQTLLMTTDGNFFMLGNLSIGAAVGGSHATLEYNSGGQCTVLFAPQGGGAALGVALQSWDGAAGVTPLSVGGQFDGAMCWIDNSGNVFVNGSFRSAGGSSQYISGQSGGSNGHLFKSWNGVAAVNVFSLGEQLAGALAFIDTNGSLFANSITSLGGQASAGNFGAPVIVAQALRTLITSAGLHTILTFSIPANGLYRVTFAINIQNTVASTPHAIVNWTAVTGASSASPIGETNGSGIQAINGGFTFPITWGDINLVPMVAQMNAGTLTATYQTSATASDTISVLIERLA